MVRGIAAGGGRPWVGQVDANLTVKPSGIGGHDNNAIREEDGLGDRMGDEEDELKGIKKEEIKLILYNNKDKIMPKDDIVV